MSHPGEDEWRKIVVELQAVAEAQNHSGQIHPLAGFVQDRLIAAGKQSLLVGKVAFRHGNRPRRAGQAEGTQAVLTGLGQAAALADGRVEQEGGVGGTEPCQKAKDKVQRQFAGFGQAKIGGLSRQVADGAIVGPEQGPSEDRAFHGNLDIVPIHHQLFFPPVNAPPPSGKAPESGALAENAAMEQLPFKMPQGIAIANPFESRFPRITAILEEKEITGGLRQRPVAGLEKGRSLLVGHDLARPRFTMKRAGSPGRRRVNHSPASGYDAAFPGVVPCGTPCPPYSWAAIGEIQPSGAPYRRPGGSW